MTTSSRFPALVGLKEAAALLGVDKTNFCALRRAESRKPHSRFPAPNWELKCGPVWLESDMLKFKRYYELRRRRLPRLLDPREQLQALRPTDLLFQAAVKLLSDEDARLVLAVAQYMQRQ